MTHGIDLLTPGLPPRRSRLRRGSASSRSHLPQHAGGVVPQRVTSDVAGGVYHAAVTPCSTNHKESGLRCQPLLLWRPPRCLTRPSRRPLPRRFHSRAANSSDGITGPADEQVPQWTRYWVPCGRMCSWCDLPQNGQATNVGVSLMVVPPAWRSAHRSVNPARVAPVLRLAVAVVCVAASGEEARLA